MIYITKRSIHEEVFGFRVIGEKGSEDGARKSFFSPTTIIRRKYIRGGFTYLFVGKVLGGVAGVGLQEGIVSTS